MSVMLSKNKADDSLLFSPSIASNTFWLISLADKRPATSGKFSVMYSAVIPSPLSIAGTKKKSNREFC